ncbi:hypothetical protein [Bosea sp. (in: a-proteobacteria)]|uniref:hypothetical protein n=1 Tax=Bosea sp. (in: a-proteobacteria) TaxID=1871050 RepID=UPI002FC96F25
MHIFIDESGSFGGVGVGASISVVGALIVPESKWPKLQQAYRRLRPRLPQDKGEVKGRLLYEADVAEIIRLLRRYETLFEATIIDLGMHTEEIIRRHQANQAVGMTDTLTDAHHPSLVDNIWKARRQLEALSMPLYVQALVTFYLVRNVLEIAPNYYAQRRPRELAGFHWVIDAKGRQANPTPWEQWWSKAIMPWMQTAMMRDPIGWCRDFNFRHTSRFETEPTEFFRSIAPSELLSNRASVLNINLLMGESFRFSYAAEPGLELVDIVTTTLRRALVGNLRLEGWRDLPSLIVNRKGENLQILALTGAESPAKRLPYSAVVKAFRNSSRSMLATRTNADR